MRPATALGADGPMNIYHAISAAAHPACRGLGTLVIFGDVLLGARGLQKRDSVPGAFSADQYGRLGLVKDRDVFIYQRPVLDLLQAEAMSEEIVRTLASAIGLVLAVPATTAIAALTVGRSREPEILPTEIIDPEEAPATQRHEVVLTRPPGTAPGRPAGAVLEHRRPGPSAADLQRAAGNHRTPTSRSEARSRRR